MNIKYYFQIKNNLGGIKMKTLLTTVITVIILAGCQSGEIDISFESVNPNATEEVSNLMVYLYSISGERTLSGQHCYSKAINSFSDSVFAITDKYQVVWGADFIGENLRLTMLHEAIKKYQQGYIITLMYHQGAPSDSVPKGVNRVRYVMNEKEWKDLITPGTKINQNWLNDIDEVAAGLKILQENKIPVLWRPYHEMNGTWFWWCDKKGEDGIKKLWKMMYDRFTNYHKLNNLIWVWNANAPRDKINDEAYAYNLYYPGNDYVDVLATDIYHNDYKQSHHDQLLDLGQGKLIAIGECGKLPTPEILQNMNHFVWFMEWASWLWSANDREDVKRLYHDERVLTLDEHQTLFLD